jgi:dTDP-4-dehydrorhamnose reductase
VVVTGANGLVGSRLCALLASEDAVTGLARGARENAGAWEYVAVDLADAGAAARAIEAARPEAVIHAAARGDVDGCEKDPEGAWRDNVSATENVARAARAAGAHLVYVSTDYVFDGASGPYAEDALPNPRGVYAVTKYAGELAAQTLAPGCAIARTAVVYGWPSARRSNFGAWLYQALARGQRLSLFADQIITPTLAENAAAMLAEVARRRLSGTWHLAGDGALSRLEFGALFVRAFAFDPALIGSVTLAEARMAAPRPVRAGLRVERAKKELAARPLSVTESIERFKGFVQASP